MFCWAREQTEFLVSLKLRKLRNINPRRYSKKHLNLKCWQTLSKKLQKCTVWIFQDYLWKCFSSVYSVVEKTFTRRKCFSWNHPYFFIVFTCFICLNESQIIYTFKFNHYQNTKKSKQTSTHALTAKHKQLRRSRYNISVEMN